MTRMILAIAGVGFALTPAIAAEPAKQAEDEAAIRKTVESYVEAFNRGDAAAVGSAWSEDARFATPSGQVLEGRKAIQDGFAAFFKDNPGAKLEVEIASIQVEPSGTAVEEGTSRVTLPEESPSETVYVARYVKQDGSWKLNSVSEGDKAPTHYEQLKELEWLIGDWVDKAGDSSIQTTCRWTKNANFITRSFAVSVADRIDLEGTQVIGWDPAKKVIRSWLFDSDGGFGVGIWTRKENRWTIQALRVLPDGRKASSVNVLIQVDDDTFTWESTGREVGGEVLPNIDPVTVVRKKPAN